MVYDVLAGVCWKEILSSSTHRFVIFKTEKAIAGFVVHQGQLNTISSTETPFYEIQL